jgi:ribosomal protein S18 acetylase RimI-like enzyme
MSVRLEVVSDAADVPGARELLREYAAGLGFDLCFQNFEQELRDLPGCYAPPHGRLLLARVDDELAGCVALRPLAAEVGEVKRLYVRPAYRGLGLGRQLVGAVLAAGREIGYQRLCLDTHPTMTAAQALYRDLGSQPTEPYCHNPHPGVLYFALDLGATPEE